MAFLSSVAGYVVTAILSALGGWLLKMLHVWQKDRSEKAASEAASQKAIDELKKANTPGELEDAAKGIADQF